MSIGQGGAPHLLYFDGLRGHRTKHGSDTGRVCRTRDTVQPLPAACPNLGRRSRCPAGLFVPTISLDPLLSADEPTSPKKPKSIPKPEPGDTEGEATSPPPSEWTSVRISPGEDVAGQDVLAVCVLVTSDDSRYA